MKRLATLLLTATTFAACGEASAPATSGTEPLPADALTFDYCRGHLYFDAAVCDSLSARLVFDTGATGLLLDKTWLARPGRHRIETVHGDGRRQYDVETKERL